MSKNFWIGAAEIGIGLFILPPSPEDIPFGGASIPATATIGGLMVLDGMRRL